MLQGVNRLHCARAHTQALEDNCRLQFYSPGCKTIQACPFARETTTLRRSGSVFDPVTLVRLGSVHFLLSPALLAILFLAAVSRMALAQPAFSVPSSVTAFSIRARCSAASGMRR